MRLLRPNYSPPAMAKSIAIAILAGGLSTRMGTDKSFALLDGKPLIAHVIGQTALLSLPTMIIANQPEAYQEFGLPVFMDVIPNRSSLAGLYSALYHSPADYTLCVACDMPFLNPNLLKYLMSLCTGFDAVVPIIGDRPQGLHTFYRKTCLTTMFRRLGQNQFRIRDLYGELQIARVAENTLRQYDPNLDSFINLNTPEALATAVAKLHRP